MYETTGSSWAASYRLFLGAQGRLDGAALLGAGTLLLPDAEVQLLSGDIGQGQPPQFSGGRVDQNATYIDGVPVAKSFAMSAPQPMSAEAAGEGHLYTLPERVSFTPGTSVVVPLFEPTPAIGGPSVHREWRSAILWRLRAAAG